MRADQTLRGTGRIDALLLGLAVLAFGLGAAWLGQSNNWDLRNYHWYNGWAWLHDRHHLDLAAAQAQTWFNPLLPAGLYLLLSSLKPWLGTFVLGALQGLNVVPLHRIAQRLLPDQRVLALLAAVVGATGATQRGELGASFGDNLVSLPLLCALALLAAPSSTLRRSVVAGVLLGIAVGLKLTAAPAAAGIACAGLWLFQRRGQLRQHGVALAGSAVAAFLLVNGPWMWQLWHDYGNPLFPMFGTLFGGEFAAPVELRDTRWLPRDSLQWMFYPLAWADQPRRVSELWFLDLRVPLWFLAMLLLPFWWSRARAQSTQPQILAFVILVTALIYAFWLVLFGYYRYLVVLEMLAPLLLVIAMLAIPRRSGLALTIILLVVVGLATRAPRWGRLSEYGEHFVEIELPSVPLNHALVIFGDGSPLSFLVPAFPASTRFVRLRGNLLGPPLPTWALDRLVQKRIHTHQGQLYLLIATPIGAELSNALAAQGLRLQGDCRPVRSNLGAGEPSAKLCPLQR